jgi:hypothetical protein
MNLSKSCPDCLRHLLGHDPWFAAVEDFRERVLDRAANQEMATCGRCIAILRVAPTEVAFHSPIVTLRIRSSAARYPSIDSELNGETTDLR